MTHNTQWASGRISPTMEGELSKTELLVPERWDHVLALLNARGRVRVEEIVGELGVSFTTARRDLRQMHRQGLVMRTRGGAVRPRHVGTDQPLSRDRELQVLEKETIGKAAALLIEPGDTLMSDGGTTAPWVYHYLPDMPITVVTNSVEVGVRVAPKENVELVWAGGMYDRKHNCLAGPLAERQLQALRGDKAIVGAAGISARDGLTEPSAPMAEIKTIMIERCNQCIVVADHSKLGVGTLFSVVPIGRVDVIVTDKKADPALLRDLRSAGVRVIIAEELLAEPPRRTPNS